MVQSDRPPSGNLAAYNAYLQGKFYFARNTEPDYRQAITQYQMAVKDDPRYALAWARLARTSANLATQFLGGQPAQQAYAKARAAADTALTLDPDLADQHAIQLAPNDGPSLFGMGSLMAALGRPGQAVALTRRALATDPLNADWYHWWAHYLSGLDRLDEAVAASHKAIELQPAATSYHEWLTVIEVLRGNAKAALAAAQAEPANGGWQGVALALARQIGPDRVAWIAPGPTVMPASPTCSSIPSSCATGTTRASPRSAARWACQPPQPRQCRDLSIQPAHCNDCPRPKAP